MKELKPLQKDRSILIAQLPSDNFDIGYAKEGLQINPAAIKRFPVPFVNGRPATGLDKDGKKVVEQFYGRSFDNPADYSFWSSLSFEQPGHIKYIDLAKPDELLKVSIMRFMGMCATSTDEAEANPNNSYLFVIKDKKEDNQKALSIYKRRDETIIQLDQLRKKNEKQFLAVVYEILEDPFELGVDVDEAYLKIREYIDKASAEKLEEAVVKMKKPSNEVIVTMDVKIAIRKNIIRRGPKGYYNAMSDTIYGKTIDETVKFLIADDQEYGVDKNPSPYSIKSQLINK